jgi:hypothetical protein
MPVTPDEAASYYETDEDPADIQHRFEESTRGGVTAPPEPKLELRPVTFMGRPALWAIVDTGDDLVLMAEVQRKFAEEWLDYLTRHPEDVKYCRDSALAAAHEHVGDEIVGGEQYAGHIAKEN